MGLPGGSKGPGAERDENPSTRGTSSWNQTSNTGRSKGVFPDVRSRPIQHIPRGLVPTCDGTSSKRAMLAIVPILELFWNGSCLKNQLLAASSLTASFAPSSYYCQLLTTTLLELRRLFRARERHEGPEPRRSRASPCFPSPQIARHPNSNGLQPS